MADEFDAHLQAAYVKLVEELTKVKAQRDRGDDDWEYSFLRVMWLYLEAIQVPQGLTAPVQAMLLAKASEIEKGRRRRKGDRRTLKTSGEILPMASAAALVTALAKHVDMSHALQVVSRKSGIDRKKLKNFRENCLRAAQSPETLKAYNYVLAVIESEQWSVERIAEASAHIHEFVNRPATNNT
jgi:hypothetical protein